MWAGGVAAFGSSAPECRDIDGYLLKLWGVLKYADGHSMIQVRQVGLYSVVASRR